MQFWVERHFNDIPPSVYRAYPDQSKSLTKITFPVTHRIFCRYYPGYGSHLSMPGTRAVTTRMTTLKPKPKPQPETVRGSAMAQLASLLHERCGADFTKYDASVLDSRIRRRMGLHHIDALPVYVRYLRENPGELDLLFSELLIGVTRFFRDAALWAELVGDALPALLAATPPGTLLRAWVPACSTGEEAYSLAMCFVEACDRIAPDARPALQIFATDLDPDAIDKARQAIYPPHITADVAPAHQARFFEVDAGGFRVNQHIRNMVIFAPQDLLVEPPFTRLDIVSCRNLLIYLTPDAQQRVLALLHYALKPDGLLLLGHTEDLIGYNTTGTALFALPPGGKKIHRRNSGQPPAAVTAAQALGCREPSRTDEAWGQRAPADNLRTQVDRFLLARYMPAAVLVNAQGDVLHIRGDIEPYLETPAGKTNWNVVALAREGLRRPLATAIGQAALARGRLSLKCLRVTGAPAEQGVDVTVDATGPWQDDAGTRVLVVFFPVELPPCSLPQREPSDSACDRCPDVQQARAATRAAWEETQVMQERLRGVNEKLLAFRNGLGQPCLP